MISRMEFLEQITELKNFEIEINRLENEIYTNDLLIILLKKLYLVRVQKLVNIVLENIS